MTETTTTNTAARSQYCHGEEHKNLIEREQQNDHVKTSANENRGQGRGLVHYLLGSELEPLRYLCSCAWMMPCLESEWTTSQSDNVNAVYRDEVKDRKTCIKINFETIVQTTKYIYSVALLGFCIQIILAGIMSDETPVAQATHWSVACAFMWLLILWLGMLEGGQGALVGLQPIDKELYRDSHTIAYRCTLLAHKGDNLNRFIVGRQLLVVLVVFGINLCCSVVQEAIVPGFSDAMIRVFLQSGLAVMLITVILGQLSAEVNATSCMLDFINTPAMLATTWVCLAIESSGVLHSVYLVQNIVTVFSGDSAATTNREPRTFWQQVFFWGRVLFSLSCLTFSFVVTLSALTNDQTTMYEGLSAYASIGILFCLICFLGMLEAMQIALFAVVNLSNDDIREHPVAHFNCQLAFEGHNFQAFLIGRQICVTMCMFLLARITTTDVDTEAGSTTILGMPSILQNFFNTGLPGALITTIVASLVWRIYASCFPIAFMANPLVNITIRSCLALEASGVFSAAWLFAKILKQVVGFRMDEDYIGPIGQRNSHCHADPEAPCATESLSSGYGTISH